MPKTPRRVERPKRMMTMPPKIVSVKPEAHSI
jgi:hypothetical protein